MTTGTHHALCLLGSLALGALILTATYGASAQDSEAALDRARPVTVLELQQEDFVREARLTGSVAPYRQENVGFEVDGRLLWVLDLGKEVEGPAFDEASKLVRQGDVIAKLDDTRYRLQVQALEARLAALKKTLQAQRIDVERVAVANLNAVRAQLRVAESEVEVAERQIAEAVADANRTQKDLARQASLRDSDSPAFQQKNLDDAQAAYDGALARQQQREAVKLARQQARDAQIALVSVQEATIVLKEAEIESTEASITELAEDLDCAREDLADTTLYAPFSGRITDIHVSQGAVVSEVVWEIRTGG